MWLKVDDVIERNDHRMIWNKTLNFFWWSATKSFMKIFSERVSDFTGIREQIRKKIVFPSLRRKKERKKMGRVRLGRLGTWLILGFTCFWAFSFIRFLKTRINKQNKTNKNIYIYFYFFLIFLWIFKFSIFIFFRNFFFFICFTFFVF